MLWGLFAILIVLALLALLPALRGKRHLQLESSEARNISIAKERKREILSLAEAGELKEEEKDAALRDLEASLAADLSLNKAQGADTPSEYSPVPSRWGIIAALLLIPLISIGMYQLTGTPDADQLAETTQQPKQPPSLADLVSGLEQKVAENPADMRGQILLAETYKRLRRYKDAVNAYETVATLADTNAPEYANVLASRADALIMANDEMFTPPAVALLNQAISLDPEHIDSRWLLGMAAAELGNTERALDHWNRLRPLLSDQPDYLAELDRMIANAKGETAQPAPSVIAQAQVQSNTAEAAANTTSAEKGLTVIVSLDNALFANAQATDSVFIFARAENGPPMPLAVSRQTVADLPITVMLDDSMAMMPQMKLSNFPRVLVGARISKTGQPVAQAGDLQSALFATDNPSDRPITLTISETVE